MTELISPIALKEVCHGTLCRSKPAYLAANILRSLETAPFILALKAGVYGVPDKLWGWRQENIRNHRDGADLVDICAVNR